MLKLSPSILAADFAQLGNEIKMVEQAGADYLHIDVMDGMFVPSISLGMPVIKSIRSVSKQFFDVHLMVQNPERYIDEFVQSGADGITIHMEACERIEDTLMKIKSFGIKAGLSISPDTEVKTLQPYLKMVDMILVMTVYPGRGGQAYLESSTNKISKVRHMIEEAGLDIDVEVDGGIYLDNLEKVVKAGANVIVAGSAIFEKDKTKDNALRFLHQLNQLENSL